ncbi:MAG: hypothetical protein KBE09_03500 [Candidatus Pacebacteria bacterium]|nr:hypothetical protein [Candidatus Paceibacterota bacterium]
MEWITKIVTTLQGITKEEWRIFIAIAVSLCSLVGTLSFLYGRAKGWRDRRNHIDRDNLVVESAIFKARSDGRIEFAIETLNQLPTLHAVFGNPHLEHAVRKAVTRRTSGQPLLAPGSEHYDAMERVCTYVTGPDPAATQSALFGRHDAYYVDETAVLLTSAAGEDGIIMPRIIKANPSDLRELRAGTFDGKMVPLREVHRDYIPLLRRMAEEYVKSQAIFAGNPNERDAGRQAGVWVAVIRTQKVVTHEMVVDMVTRAVRRIITEASMVPTGLAAEKQGASLTDRLKSVERVSRE